MMAEFTASTDRKQRAFVLTGEHVHDWQREIHRIFDRQCEVAVSSE